MNEYEMEQEENNIQLCYDCNYCQFSFNFIYCNWLKEYKKLRLKELTKCPHYRKK